ncbi:hypothetical protein E5288_WYG006472 [Bos mutus]|uniref:GAGE domain-containing protein n=1 Tax=Bos mutus TaxID=72004 RepID=A0A6B0SHM6_9CETA|nr:hypothetical protein [Bos mutus]
MTTLRAFLLNGPRSHCPTRAKLTGSPSHAHALKLQTGQTCEPTCSRTVYDFLDKAYCPTQELEGLGPENGPNPTLVNSGYGRNMSGQVASTLGPTKQDCSQVDEPVVDQQPSVEQRQQEKPPAVIQDITPRQEEVHGEDPVNRDEEEEKDPFEAELMHFFKDSGLEADLQQLALAKTGGEGGDGPDVREEFASNIEPGEMPEAGSPQEKWKLLYRA